jgi:hypothetical protein
MMRANDIMRPSPWRPIDVAVLWSLQIAAAAVLSLGWWGISGTNRLAHQVIWLNLAAAGLLLSGAGVALWLTTGRGAIGHRRRRTLADPVTSAVAVRPDTKAGGTLVAAARMTRFHRADCSFVEGKAVTSTSEVDHRAAGRTPCGVCLGDPKENRPQ